MIYMVERSQNRVHGTDRAKQGPGRPKLYAEQLRVPLPAGTIARIDAARTHDEDRLTLIRSAIERELRRRKKAS